MGPSLRNNKQLGKIIFLHFSWLAVEPITNFIKLFIIVMSYKPFFEPLKDNRDKSIFFIFVLLLWEEEWKKGFTIPAFEVNVGSS